MNLRRVAAAGLAATGAALLGTAAVAVPASADTSPYAEGTTLGPWPVLKRSHKGEEVRALQWFLNCMGYKVDVPSHFGPATQGRVMQLQKNYQAKGGADGNVGAYTWMVILTRSKPMGYGQKNDCVKALQVLLNKWRYDEDLPIIGVHGPKTQKKLKRFQQEHGMHPTGLPDIGTVYKLLVTPKGK